MTIFKNYKIKEKPSLINTCYKKLRNITSNSRDLSMPINPLLT